MRDQGTGFRIEEAGAWLDGQRDNHVAKESLAGAEYSVLSTEYIEPERYELLEPPHYHFDFDRRDALKALGGGVLVTLITASSAAQQRGQRGRGGGNSGPQQIGGW